VSKKFTIKSPEGEIIEGDNIKKFCTQKGLNISSISKVIRGKLKSHKGWCLP